MNSNKNHLPYSPINILNQYWHHNSFRPHQEEIIQSILAGKDTLALMPTGGGKSICYQVPALMKPGLCLVISPLIALMKDQVANLVKRDIPALSIHSGMKFKEVENALRNAANGEYKFLYVSPERLQTNLFKEYISSLNINLIAVDEAHCISQWGYDFRPPYLRIAELRKEIKQVPVLAVTASATPLVLDDIAEKLQLKNFSVFRLPFERPNISYSVFNADSKINKLVEIFKNVSGSGIVYCKSRRLTKEICELLLLHDIQAVFYHAGLLQQERNEKQDSWINNKVRVIVCTNAFGMGIDKPDVRTVVHYDAPDCLENYYQEAGRAGRDRKKSYAVLLYSNKDEEELKALPDIRFPAMKDIRKVYQHLADYLQVPVGIGEGNYYDFDLNNFVKNFKLDVLLVMSVLRVLEQEGFINFNENIFLPSEIKFTIPKELLLDFEKNNTALEPLIKILLRTYEGIFESSVKIHEKLIAKLLRQHEDIVIQQLHKLVSYNIIEYTPQKDSPQIYFFTNRAPAQSLAVNPQHYLHRKQQYELRLETMLRYLDDAKICRSRFIAHYFGDFKTPACGICDICLGEKKQSLDEEMFKKIEQRIYKNIPEDGTTVKELLHHLHDIRKEHVWKVINFLQSERILNINTLGLVHCKKSVIPKQ